MQSEVINSLKYILFASIVYINTYIINRQSENINLCGTDNTFSGWFIYLNKLAKNGLQNYIQNVLIKIKYILA